MRRVFIFAMLAAALAPAATTSAQSVAEKHVAQQIGAHLKQSGQMHNYRVGVKYHDGVACLAGTVDSPEQHDIALRLAHEVEGVSNVIDRIEVTNSRGGGIAQIDGNSGESQDMTESLNRTGFESAQMAPSGVTHAYQNSGPPMQQNQMMMQQNAMQQNPRMQSAMTQRPAPRSLAQQAHRSNMPLPAGRLPGMMPVRQASATSVRQASGSCPCEGGMGGPGGGMGSPDGGGAPMGFSPNGAGRGVSNDNPQMPGYAWPSYASYPNYAALSYPQQYSPTAWPYIGPFYPYPQVPLAWRKVALEWDDGWWFLDFSSHNSSH